VEVVTRRHTRYGVLREFERACEEVKKDPTCTAVWQCIIGQYRPTFLSRCQNAIDWSNAFVHEQLATVMLKASQTPKKRQPRLSEG